MTIIEDQIRELVEALSPGREFDPLSYLSPRSFGEEEEETIDPVARITEQPGVQETLTPIKVQSPDEDRGVGFRGTQPGVPRNVEVAEQTRALNQPTYDKPVGVGAKAGSKMTTGDFVLKMLAKEGTEYEYGGTTRKTGWDCSGIIYRIMLNAGHSAFPRTSAAQYAHSKKISLKKAINTRGAILFGQGGGPSGNHIAISLGNGQTIEAMGEDYGVVKGNAHGRFTGGGLFPELKVGATIRAARKAKNKGKAFRPVFQEVKETQPEITLSSLVSAPMVFGTIQGEIEGEALPTPPGEKPVNAPGLKFVPKKYRSWIQDAAEKSRLSPRLIAYVMQKESGFSEDVVNFQRDSSAGARGGMQIMPFWSETYGDKIFTDPRYNVIIGAQILANYINQQGNLRDGLASYNAGPGNMAAGYGYADSVLDSFRGRN